MWPDKLNVPRLSSGRCSLPPWLGWRCFVYRSPVASWTDAAGSAVRCSELGRQGLRSPTTTSGHLGGRVAGASAGWVLSGVHWQRQPPKLRGRNWSLTVAGASSQAGGQVLCGLAWACCSLKGQSRQTAERGFCKCSQCWACGPASTVHPPWSCNSWPALCSPCSELGS